MVIMPHQIQNFQILQCQFENRPHKPRHQQLGCHLLCGSHCCLMDIVCQFTGFMSDLLLSNLVALLFYISVESPFCEIGSWFYNPSTTIVQYHVTIVIERTSFQYSGFPKSGMKVEGDIKKCYFCIVMVLSFIFAIKVIIWSNCYQFIFMSASSKRVEYQNNQLSSKGKMLGEKHLNQVL